VIASSTHIRRLDPDAEYRNAAACGLERELILFCSDDFSSSLADASLSELGFTSVGDLVGGYNAWHAAGLPVRPVAPPAADRPPGMGRPEPIEQL